MPKVKPLGVTPEMQMDENFRLWTRHYLAEKNNRNIKSLGAIYKISGTAARARYIHPETLRLDELRRAAKHMTDEEILSFVRK